MAESNSTVDSAVFAGPWGTPFLEPGDLSHAQLAFVTLIYAVVLYQASGLISGGSELLQFVPAIAGIVGSIVLPILGAVPDGMMVLFSGIGPNAQETVSVGVGALAGSTVMLLTFPWFICIYYGGVPLSNGEADYAKKDQEAPVTSRGIRFQGAIPKAAKIMLSTTLLYAIIQLPATIQEHRGLDTLGQAAKENTPALIGLIACILSFTAYLVSCLLDASDDKLLGAVVKSIKNKKMSIAAALEIIASNNPVKERSTELLDRSMRSLRMVCKPFFKRYDYNQDKQLSPDELKPLLTDLGLDPQDSNVSTMLKEMDVSGDGTVDFEEFVKYLHDFMCDSEKMKKAPKVGLPVEEAEESDEEMPADLLSLTPAQQRRKLLIRACWMMSTGTFLVLIFSDPMVDCLSELGKRLGISAFYVSFILAPFASNASELLSAYTFAVKKTPKSITTSLSTLIGAACMNNTFVLAIFLALIYKQGLAWQFTAETLAMVLIQWVIGLLAIKCKTQTFTTGVLILLCYPGCLALVWILENLVGLD